MKKLITLIAMLAIAGMATADVLISFGETTGNVASPDDNGNYWNEADQNDTVASLIDEDNVASGISMTVSANGDTANNAGPTTAAGAFATYAMSVQNATGESPSWEYIYNDGNNATASTVTFGGMAEGYLLELVIFGGAGINANSYESLYELSGGGATVSQAIVTGAAGVANNSLVATLSQTADASGNVVLTLSAASGRYSQLNAIQIVPEPATVGLLGLGALIALLARRMQA